jgi:hypothetical protein
MAAARIAAAFLIALAPIARAQQNSQSLVTVQVTDLSGAPIPGAQVEAAPLCTVPLVGQTDNLGKISFNLEPGPWDTRLTVASPGFCPEKKTIRVLDQPTQAIPVELELGGCPTKCTPICVTVESTGAPKPAQGRIDVLVTDTTGAVFPGARVEVDPLLPMPGPVLKADSKGRASLDLPGGIHALTVTGPGFYPWTDQIDVSGATNQIIEAVLQAEPICDPVVVSWFAPDMPLGIPEPVFLPARPMLNLDPLPARLAKKRW